ncbi:NUDIX hydrolase [Nocardiopsis tropica]|uniref:NUDIX domain-containing protein n=1 Tax=Nocardiopsis tropica TaxID=109330 RepID=A0ABV2A2X3_9ACTN
MTITDELISTTLAVYLGQRPDEAGALAEPVRLLRRGRDFASRRTFPMHVTVGALLVHREAGILLVRHRAYGLLLQPGGHLDPGDTALAGAALRELVEETGVEAGTVSLSSRVPAYVEFGRVPARPDKDEPDHCHLDFGYAFTTARAEIGRVQESEVTGADWYPLPLAERLVGPRVARAAGPSGRID